MDWEQGLLALMSNKFVTDIRWNVRWVYWSVLLPHGNRMILLSNIIRWISVFLFSFSFFFPFFPLWLLEQLTVLVSFCWHTHGPTSAGFWALPCSMFMTCSLLLVVDSVCQYAHISFVFPNYCCESTSHPSMCALHLNFSIILSKVFWIFFHIFSGRSKTIGCLLYVYHQINLERKRNCPCNIFDQPLPPLVELPTVTCVVIIVYVAFYQWYAIL